MVVLTESIDYKRHLTSMEDDESLPCLVCVLFWLLLGYPLTDTDIRARTTTHWCVSALCIFSPNDDPILHSSFRLSPQRVMLRALQKRWSDTDLGYWINALLGRFKSYKLKSRIEKKSRHASQIQYSLKCRTEDTFMRFPCTYSALRLSAPFHPSETISNAWNMCMFSHFPLPLRCHWKSTCKDSFDAHLKLKPHRSHLAHRYPSSLLLQSN